MTTVDRLAGVRGSLAYKAPVVAGTTAAITLTGEQTIDDISVVDGDRVLVMDQSSGIENGIYVASTGDWQRAKDFNGIGDVIQGSQVYIAQGSRNGLTSFRVTTANDITIGTTSLTFTPTLLVQIPFVASGALGSSEELGPFLATGRTTFFAGLVDSQAIVRIAPAAEAILSIQKNLVEVGTITFALGETEGTLSLDADFSLDAGDTLSIIAPAIIDATLEHFSATLRAFG